MGNFIFIFIILISYINSNYIYCEKDFNFAVKCFQKWCLNYDLPLTHSILMEEKTGYFTQIPNEKQFDTTKRSNSQCLQSDKKVTKILKFKQENNDF